MAFLIDTSILVRLANAHDPDHLIAAAALVELHRRSEIINITAQVLIDFRNVATRPKALNGAGLSITDTEGYAVAFEAKFPLLAETPDIFHAWKSIVSALGVIGKRVHDARLVAVCHVHGVTHVLTFNVAHFVSMAGFGPGIIVVHPANV